MKAHNAWVFFASVSFAAPAARNRRLNQMLLWKRSFHSKWLCCILPEKNADGKSESGKRSRFSAQLFFPKKPSNLSLSGACRRPMAVL
jgi:hypothetical protein